MEFPIRAKKRAASSARCSAVGMAPTFTAALARQWRRPPRARDVGVSVLHRNNGGSHHGLASDASWAHGVGSAARYALPGLLPTRLDRVHCWSGTAMNTAWTASSMDLPFMTPPRGRHRVGLGETLRSSRLVQRLDRDRLVLRFHDAEVRPHDQPADDDDRARRQPYWL